ncbi:hypothetical protein BDW71DRAFT_191167 [Aspergillus fruticulosus]
MTCWIRAPNEERCRQSNTLQYEPGSKHEHRRQAIDQSVQLRACETRTSFKTGKGKEPLRKLVHLPVTSAIRRSSGRLHLTWSLLFGRVNGEFLGSPSERVLWPYAFHVPSSVLARCSVQAQYLVRVNHPRPSLDNPLSICLPGT